MKARVANKIVRSVGFHAFDWSASPNRYHLVGHAYKRYRWTFCQIAEAWKCRTIYPKKSKGRVEIRMFPREGDEN